QQPVLRPLDGVEIEAGFERGPRRRSRRRVAQGREQQQLVVGLGPKRTEETRERSHCARRRSSTDLSVRAYSPKASISRVPLLSPCSRRRIATAGTERNTRPASSARATHSSASLRRSDSSNGPTRSKAARRMS